MDEDYFADKSLRVDNFPLRLLFMHVRIIKGGSL
jgi:hypothetical protein